MNMPVDRTRPIFSTLIFLGKRDRFVAMVSFGMPLKNDANVCIKKRDGVKIILIWNIY